MNLAQVPRPDPPFKQLLTDHFGADPSGLPSIVENFDLTDHPNLQIALDAYLEGEGRSGTTLGITSPHKRYMGIGLSDLVGARSTDDAPTPGPVEYLTVALGDDSLLTCVRNGLYLIRDREGPLAALITKMEQGSWQTLTVEVLAPERTTGERFLADLRHSMKQKNVYRGATLEMSQEPYGPLQVEIRKLPEIPRERVVLPEGVLERIELLARARRSPSCISPVGCRVEPHSLSPAKAKAFSSVFARWHGHFSPRWLSSRMST